MDKYLTRRVSSRRGATSTAATRSPTLDRANMPEQASALTENVGASSSDDVGTFVAHPAPVMDLEKYCLMKNHFVPERNYKFPQDPVTKWSFQHKWLMDNRRWLVYRQAEEQKVENCQFRWLFIPLFFDVSATEFRHFISNFKNFQGEHAPDTLEKNAQDVRGSTGAHCRSIMKM